LLNIVTIIVTFAVLLALGGALHWANDVFGNWIAYPLAFAIIIASLGGAVLLDKRRLRLPWRSLWRYYRQEGRSPPESDKRH